MTITANSFSTNGEVTPMTESVELYSDLYIYVQAFTDSLGFKIARFSEEDWKNVPQGGEFARLMNDVRTTIEYFRNIDSKFTPSPDETLEEWSNLHQNLEIDVMYSSETESPFLVIRSRDKVGDYEPGSSIFLIHQEPYGEFMLTMASTKEGYVNKEEVLNMLAEAQFPASVLRDENIFENTAQIWLNTTTRPGRGLQLEHLDPVTR